MNYGGIVTEIQQAIARGISGSSQNITKSNAVNG